MKIETERNTVKQTLGHFKTIGDDHAFVSVTSWNNGEGYDCDINERGCRAFFQITCEQWLAFKKVMKQHLRENE